LPLSSTSQRFAVDLGGIIAALKMIRLGPTVENASK
jgi:hypothetical protein